VFFTLSCEYEEEPETEAATSNAARQATLNRNAVLDALCRRALKKFVSKMNFRGFRQANNGTWD
jgi:hypothetical protein